MAVDPRNFLLNTDYEMDKIVYFTSGDITTDNGAFNPKVINHGLSFIPLIFGVCSFNSDFSDARTIPFDQITQSSYVVFTASADSTSIVISYTNYATDAPKMYYRIYAFEPSDSAAMVEPTNIYAQEFVLNTDYNYCKLYKKGFVTSDTTITHDLGYIPQVLAWRESSDPVSGTVVSPVEISYRYGSGGGFNVTVRTNNIQIRDMSGFNIVKVHYRIYYDEE